MKKFLFCKKCQNYPDKIYEQYEGQLIEERVWDGYCYGLEDTNMDDMEMTPHCAECYTELEEIDFRHLPKKIQDKILVNEL